MILNYSSFICPICGSRLFILDNTYRCFKGHSFDKAKQGYVNLLLQGGSGKRHGDDKLMVMARRSFLEKGYYDKLRDEINEIIGEGYTVLDSGCGEGYYTAKFSENNKVLGIDISKDAIKYAASRCKNSEFAVASISSLPIENNSIDKVVAIFSPDAPSEFSRVLKTEGRLITATPMENHLFELKTAVYDKPYSNPKPNLQKQGFEVLNTYEVKYKIKLDNTEDIINLFKMTPYYYKTSAEDQEKLTKLCSLTTSLEFIITEYEKEPSL
ncbi:MAG: methyltransferase domain-containing protein [Clostridia bacterium]|nr:methyltransferase domain-containing protein [Clostridia bacterium]